MNLWVFFPPSCLQQWSAVAEPSFFYSLPQAQLFLKRCRSFQKRYLPCIARTMP